jgi:hypothetical protein
MSALNKEAPNRFRVRFREMATGLKKLLGSEFFQVDPFLIARALVQVMKTASMRSASGRLLVWNHYQVILAPDDFEPLRRLQERVQDEIGKVVAGEARAVDAELVGDLCVRLVADEGRELAAGEGVVRVEFAPSERLAPARAGDVTIRIDRADIVSGELIAPAAPPARPPSGGKTVIVEDPGPPPAYALLWPGGSAELLRDVRVILGREHAGPPAGFIALRGASERINKQQLWLLAGPAALTVGRLPGANPVAVDGELVRAGEHIEVKKPALQIDLSRGDLILSVTRTSG